MALYTHIHALYILHICTCTCILDVSKRGVLGSADDDVAFFLHVLCVFIGYVFSGWSWACFFGRMPAYSTYSKYDIAFFSAYYDMFYWSWVDSFAIYMRILHICSIWKTRDGRKFVKNFGVLGVSGLSK